MVGRVVPDEDRALRIELVDPLDDARPLPLGQRIDAIVDRMLGVDLVGSRRIQKDRLDDQMDDQGASDRSRMQGKQESPAAGGQPDGCRRRGGTGA
jgi:hypothetical protein